MGPLAPTMNDNGIILSPAGDLCSLSFYTSLFSFPAISLVSSITVDNKNIIQYKHNINFCMIKNNCSLPMNLNIQISISYLKNSSVDSKFVTRIQQ